METQKKKTIIVTGILLLLLLVIGSTYAYFSIQASSNQTGANIKGSAAKLGNPTLRTEVANLYLNLDANLMSQANAGKTYYANKDESGLALTINPNYTLATASVPDADAPLDCTYNYKVTATVTKTITDGSDSNVIVTVGNKTMTLKELTTAGTNGIIVSGEFKNLTTGVSQTISLSSSVENTNVSQDNLVGNSYTINIAPYTNGDTKAFSCKLAFQFDSKKSLAQNLIDSEWLWQSGLEGDGYRYVGSGAVGTETNPNNFICFGTTSKSDCTSNQDKYMYRILGVFPDESGEQHVKLIKYKQLESYAWHSDYSTDTSWENSDMYKGLNGSYFLTNTTYDYLQNSTWLSKIENWTWSAVDTLTDSNAGPSYNIVLSPKEIYLHEMNRSTKTNIIGNWTTPLAKIGLMYVSDYVLSLGSSALALTTGTHDNGTLLKTGWMHQSNNDTTKKSSEWTLSRNGAGGGDFYAWYVAGVGLVSDVAVDNSYGSRPVLYLTSNEKLNSGTGSLDDPFVIQ